MFGMAEGTPSAVKSAPTPRMLGGPAIEHIFDPGRPVSFHQWRMYILLAVFLPPFASKVPAFVLVRGSLWLALRESAASKNKSL